jgi:hypothetical protein
MRKSRAIVALTAMLPMLLGSGVARADDHLATRGTVGATLNDAASERARNLESLDRALSSPKAARAAKVVGVGMDQVRGSLNRLSDTELRDLSRRAAALGSNPAAGHYHHDEAEDAVELLVFIAIIGAIAIAAVEIANS